MIPQDFECPYCGRPLREHRVVGSGESTQRGCPSRFDPNLPEYLYQEPAENFWDDRTTPRAYGRSDADRELEELRRNAYPDGSVVKEDEK